MDTFSSDSSSEHEVQPSSPATTSSPELMQNIKFMTGSTLDKIIMVAPPNLDYGGKIIQPATLDLDQQFFLVTK